MVKRELLPASSVFLSERLQLPRPGSPRFVRAPPTIHSTPAPGSLWKEWPALVTSSSARQPSLGSLACCYEGLRSCVLRAFPFVVKPFISVCVVDVYSKVTCRVVRKCLPRWTSWCSELPADLDVAGAAHWPLGNCWVLFCFSSKQTNHFWMALLCLISFHLFNDQDAIIRFVYHFVEIVMMHIYVVVTVCQVLF